MDVIKDREGGGGVGKEEEEWVCHVWRRKEGERLWRARMVSRTARGLAGEDRIEGQTDKWYNTE